MAGIIAAPIGGLESAAGAKKVVVNHKVCVVLFALSGWNSSPSNSLLRRNLVRNQGRYRSTSVSPRLLSNAADVREITVGFV